MLFWCKIISSNKVSGKIFCTLLCIDIGFWVDFVIMKEARKSKNLPFLLFSFSLYDIPKIVMCKTGFNTILTLFPMESDIVPVGAIEE
ncbi:MAG: hypothetical protein Ct9H90mP13_08670 [Pseudomonadota bacterium]|nr:MAG: hypothetical protein Ct9H90mP13_08670 [Pseudomonadota bacterium]